MLQKWFNSDCGESMALARKLAPWRTYNSGCDFTLLQGSDII